MNGARFLYFLAFLSFFGSIRAQNSPLSQGKWAKIGATKQGIYKMSGAQLSTLGFSLPIGSAQLQMHHFNLSRLTEKVEANAALGLSEIAIKVMDGGDGQIDAKDYILFYNQGPVFWNYDAVLNRSSHVNFSAADTVYFFITLGQNGKRISTQNLQSNSSETRTVFTQHILFEKDTVSLLNSGKVFYGTPMGQGANKQSQLNYTFTSQGMNTTSSLKSFVHMASTSYQANGQFDFYLNDELQKSSSLNPVSGLLFDDIASELTDSFTNKTINSWPNKSNLKVTYTSASASATGWVDYIEMIAKKPIGFWQDNAIEFSIEDDLKKGGYANCTLQTVDSSVLIWDVTSLENPMQMVLQIAAGGVGNFIQKTDTIVNLFGVKQAAFESPILLGSVVNQNTFAQTTPEYIIVSAPAYLNAAKKYQQFQNQKFGRNAIVVNAKEIYNDFSGGQVSAIAIRNYLKNIYTKALQINQVSPKYVLLLGIGNFNTRKINSENELPVFESQNSNSILSSFTSDDFFAILNNGDDINNYNVLKQLNLSVGRIPARTINEADSAILKLINYQANKIAGGWENKITWIADDGDYNLHLQDAESIIGNLQNKESHWDHNKIYLDLFPAENSTTGNAYPLVNTAIQQAVQQGTLLINYTGHGNYLRLSEEAVIAQPQFDLWDNASKLPLMVTASCNFAPYDQPALNAIAWNAFMKNGKGIIGLVAANRLVFAYSNKQINDLFIKQLLVKDSAGNYNSIGQALQKAKMFSWAQGGDRMNDLKFNLIGDPALLLSVPNYQLQVLKLNDKNFTGKDTLLSGNKYSIQGAVFDKLAIKNNFNGLLDITIYDAVKTKKTLANQSTSMVVPIGMQDNILFKGKATIKNGNFNVSFVLPSQGLNSTSPIRIELAASSDSNAAIKVLDSIYIKPSILNNYSDTLGPLINAYINDPLFKSGDWSKSNATLYLNLVDSSGIQTSGNALGHDLAIWLDNNPVPIIINNYFVADIDTYKSGKLAFLLPNLSVGMHTILIKAWDLLGNSSNKTIALEVPKEDKLQIRNATVFPNPFLTNARFSVETNLTSGPIQAVFEILNQSGKVVFSKAFQTQNGENRVYHDFDGITNAGTMLNTGVYYYRFDIKTLNEHAILSNIFIKL